MFSFLRRCRGKTWVLTYCLSLTASSQTALHPVRPPDDYVSDKVWNHTDTGRCELWTGEDKGLMLQSFSPARGSRHLATVRSCFQVCTRACQPAACVRLRACVCVCVRGYVSGQCSLSARESFTLRLFRTIQTWEMTSGISITRSWPVSWLFTRCPLTSLTVLCFHRSGVSGPSHRP